MTCADVTAAVILNHNDNDNALRLVAAFEKYDSIGKIVVVDNSGAGGITVLDGKKTELLRVQNNGYSAGNNAGLALIDKEDSTDDVQANVVQANDVSANVAQKDNAKAAEFVIISNPDVYVLEDAVIACVGFLRQNPNYAVAAPRMYAADGTPHHLTAWRERTFLCDFAYSSGLLSRIVGMRRECYPESYFQNSACDVDCVAGSFFVIRRDVLRRVGDFDEHTFLYYEEDILGYKLKQLGYKSAVLCGFKFIHCEGASVNKSMNYLRKYLAMQKSRLYFHRHYKKTVLPKYLALCLATALGVVEKSIKTLYSRINKD